MATLEQKIAAERHARQLLEEQGFAQPDAVEYGYTCIRLFFHEPKLCMIIQIDEPPEGWVFAEDMDDDQVRAVLAEPDPEEIEGLGF